jgi:hypothetical protein
LEQSFCTSFEKWMKGWSVVRNRTLSVSVAG